MVRIKKKSYPPSSLIVTQSNKLVEARYNLPLSEQRLILTMIARIQPDDEDFKEYRINVKEFADFLGVDNNSAYREFDKITTAIMTRVLILEESDGPLKVGWVSSAKYIVSEGAVLLCFDPKLKPYLLKLKGNFTSSKLEMLLSFKSQYTTRMYNLLKQYEKLKEREIKLDLLREILGIRKDQYSLYSNFKKDILESTQRELKSKADLYFEFEEIKYGRRVGAIRFCIVIKNGIAPKLDKKQENLQPELPPPSDNTEPLLNELLLLIPEQHRAKKTIFSALESFNTKYGFDYVKRNIMYSNANAKKSYAAFLGKALKEDWGHDWELDQNEAIKKKPVEIWEKQGFSSEKDYNDFMYTEQMRRYGVKV
ncbi:MAG: replication initiation protein [Methylococcales bacterium]|nr:replication initiation protein [Methylococcales bacterium]